MPIRDIPLMVRALNDAQWFRANHPDDADLAIIAEYEKLKVAFGIHQSLVIMPRSVMNGLELLHADIETRLENENTNRQSIVEHALNSISEILRKMNTQ
jgi:hypothetical protein